jgi:hypothetical protein
MSKSSDFGKQPLLEDSTYDIIHHLKKEADFLYSAIEKYVRDAEKDGRPELLKLWNTIKADEQHHLLMLREALVKEINQNKFS